MNGLALNFFLALVWALFLGEVSLRSLSIGFGLGFLVLWAFRDALGVRSYALGVPRVLALVGYFFWELIVANVQMARLSLMPRPPLNSMVVAVPLHLRGEVPLTMLAALTGLMPGTVTLGFSPERDVMYVHAAGMNSAEAVRASVQDIETRMLRVIGTPQADQTHTPPANPTR